MGRKSQGASPSEENIFEKVGSILPNSEEQHANV
jgi:hypothetical protein